MLNVPDTETTEITENGGQILDLLAVFCDLWSLCLEHLDL